ncbi:MAG: hypothetical protein UY27_C0009G0014 [Candidatus Gottesmanbacteria bacterium GW2011_GWA1_48_13]|uniref:Uncharacterized protein n=1 Tax=Candidatus Gottesmanbacteria bacterium GW2011_GWA1_48_13 TaxID=1618439 RepID=A0A0G1UNT9_9BACT|nr:MAG: hypothetical protein UY27_C0009G0014 [Candidatus Gottesmanbacteria bacterium GW2011_GWA1_48_13]
MMVGIVVYLDKMRVQWYQHRDAAVVSTDVPEALVHDGDVVDRLGFQTGIRSAIGQHKFTPGPVAIVVSQELCYWQEVTGDEKEKEAQTQQFLETVPYDATLSRRYVVNAKDVVVALPKELTDALRQTLGQEGFAALLVVPSLLLGQESAKRWLDAGMGKYVVTHADSLVAQNILGGEEESYAAISASHPLVPKYQQRLVLLVGIFAILVIVLAFLLFR